MLAVFRHWFYSSFGIDETLARMLEGVNDEYRNRVVLPGQPGSLLGAP
jgi:hypothetical protein